MERDRITDLTSKQRELVRAVFVLNKPAVGIRKAIEDEPCYVYDKEEDKANCRHGSFWDPDEEI